MKVKTYKNHSLQEGLEDIKRELGNEALILRTRSVKVRPPFGLFRRPSWEITAGLEEKAKLALPAHIPSNPFPAISPAASDRRFNGAGAATAVAKAVTPAIEKPKAAVLRDQRMDGLIDEMTELKKSFRSLTKSIPARGSELGGGLFNELVAQGIERELADHLLLTAGRGNPAPSEARERVRRLLADQLLIGPAIELNAKTRIVSIFIGPTGVGKTTTIAKIAGHAAVRMKKKVALISTDMVRIGGYEQLSRFGELIGVPTYGCADVSTLKDLSDSLDDRDLVLIDTPGSSPSDLARLARLEVITSGSGAKIHLVMSATTRSEDVAKIVERFKRFAPSSVIITKTDETDAKGFFVGDLLRNELAVSYLTNGQRVPEDLLIASANELARYVLPEEPSI